MAHSDISREEFKKYFEASLLDGDDVYDCGKAMILAEYAYEVVKEKREADLAAISFHFAILVSDLKKALMAKPQQKA